MPRIIIAIQGKAPQPYRFGLDRESVSMGRDSSNDVFIDCGSVSSKHAVMQRVSGGYELRDQGSTNGIKLNGRYQDVIELRNGQAVLLGDVGFEFTLSDEELAELAKEDTGAPATAVLQAAAGGVPLGSTSVPAPVYQKLIDPASVLPPMPEPKGLDPASVLPPMPPPQVADESMLPPMPEPKEAKPRKQVAQKGSEDEVVEEEGGHTALKPSLTVPAKSQSGTTFLAIVLVILAFVVGLELHHRSETGKSLIGSFLERISGKSGDGGAGGQGGDAGK